MKIITFIIAIFTLIGTFLPYWDNDHWLVRGQENFKFVYLILNLLLIAIIGVYFLDGFGTALFTMLIFGFFFCFKSVFPYTRLANIEVEKTPDDRPEDEIKLLIYNVYQYNEDYQNLIDLVNERNPDIILLLETGIEWDESSKVLEDKYPYILKEIREDTYGIKFLSRIEILEGGVEHIVTEEVPSIEALFDINGKSLRILGLHPKPPVPGEKLYSTTKDKEIMRAGKYFNTLPNEYQVLIGDLNDVAWSRITYAFKNKTGMVDPRIGRGTFSTFPTYFPIRFPLDHIFISNHFKLKEMKVERNIGSDHYPVFVHLQLQEELGEA